MKLQLFRLIIIGLLMLLTYQNCGELRSISTDLASSENLTSTQVEDQIFKAYNNAGDGRSSAFTGQIGVYLWGGQLDANSSSGKTLLNSAKMIGAVGFPTIRLALGKPISDQTNYGIPFSTSNSPKSLSDWVEVDQLRETLLDPAFPVVALTTTDMTLQGRVTHLESLKKPEIVEALFKEYFDFYNHLFSLPVSRKKTFVVSNWEGDNQIFYCPGIFSGGQKASWINDCDQTIRTDLGQSLNDSIDGFIRWNLIRKAALIAARSQNTQNSLVEIKFAIEFSQIHMISRTLSRSVVWDVIPEVKPDIALYSAYESVTRKSLVADLKEVRSYLNSKGLQNTTIGIGEIGTTGEISYQQTVLRNSLKEVAPGFPELAIGFVWNAFNTKATHDSSQESLGLWFSNGALHVAPSPGLLVPILDAIKSPEDACFTRPQRPDCEFPITGLFPQHALNQESGLLKCTSGSQVILKEVGVRYDISKIMTVTLPASVRGLHCQLQIRSDLGLPSAWSNSFQAGTPTTPKTPESPHDTGYDIILIGGQSNSSSGGRGAFTDPLAGVVDSRIAQFSCGDVNGNNILDDGEASAVVTQTEHLDDCRFGNPVRRDDIIAFGRKSFGVSFARQYAQKRLATNRKVLIVAGGVPETGSDWWVPGHEKKYFDNLMKRAQMALNLPGQNRIVAFLWSQGEADIMDPVNPTAWRSNLMIEDYAGRLKSIITTSRTTLNIPDLPFLMTEKAEKWTTYQETKLRYQDVDRWVASTLPPASLVSTTGIASNPLCNGNYVLPCEDAAYIHFSAQGHVDLAARLYQEFARIAPR